jgi:hypothetical protein
MKSAHLVTESTKMSIDCSSFVQISLHFIQISMRGKVDQCPVRNKKQGYPVATLPGLARALPFDPTPAVGWAGGRWWYGRG